MSYQQLTQEQRYQISALMQADQQNKRIAEIVGVHASTIGREVKRNRGKKGYRPKQANRKHRKENMVQRYKLAPKSGNILIVNLRMNGDRNRFREG